MIKSIHWWMLGIGGTLVTVALGSLAWSAGAAFAGFYLICIGTAVTIWKMEDLS